MKEDAIKYCINDCTMLFNIIKSFDDQILEKFKVNISSSPTLPGLAFKIYRTHYMDNKIPLMDGQVFNDLIKAYYGGHVDMYIPKTSNNQIRQYDVNGLYPFVMKSFKFPTKLIAYFIGEISKMSDYQHLYENNLGIYKVEVIAPDLTNPLLPHKVNNTSIYEQGNWTGWYFSEEMKHAMRFGYQFKFLAGYLFESEYLFNNYIDSVNQIKIEASKGSPNYLIAKLLMNALYGRFGMSPYLLKHRLLDEEALSELANNIGIENIQTMIDFNKSSIVSFQELFSKTAKSNIAVALAISAYGRIHMSQFLNHPAFTGKLYYMDTDSVFCEKELPAYMISDKELGLMKLENVFNSFRSIGPKVYGGETVDGKDLIKVKGFKGILDYLDLNLACRQEGVLLSHTKWHRKISEASIKVKESDYLLKPNSFKRDLIFREDGL